MALLRPEDIEFLSENFKELLEDVTLTVRTRERSRLILPGQDPPAEDDASAELKQLVGEVAATSPKVIVVEQAAEEDERTPSITFSTGKSLGKLRYFGLPAGYEMSTLVSTIMDLGAGDLGVPEDVKARLAALSKPVHVQVFVTPS